MVLDFVTAYIDAYNLTTKNPTTNNTMMNVEKSKENIEETDRKLRSWQHEDPSNTWDGVDVKERKLYFG